VVEDRPRLEFVSVRLSGDQIPIKQSGYTLPETYVVLFGMSRRLTPFEQTELFDSPASGFNQGDDYLWLERRTTLNEVRDHLDELQEVIAAAEMRAKALEEAAEAVDQAHLDDLRAEMQRRQELLGEINRLLAPRRQRGTE
jgi:hypothetical protein